jgi:hypothetical protein
MTASAHDPRHRAIDLAETILRAEECPSPAFVARLLVTRLEAAGLTIRDAPRAFGRCEFHQLPMPCDGCAGESRPRPGRRTMTNTPSAAPASLTRVQLHTLVAISRGRVSMPGPGIDLDLGTWRIDTGRAVTATVNSLIVKGLARPSTVVEDDRRQAVATAEGHEAISRAASRGR